VVRAAGFNNDQPGDGGVLMEIPHRADREPRVFFDEGGEKGGGAGAAHLMISAQLTWS
jgi:hypothetical protein